MQKIKMVMQNNVVQTINSIQDLTVLARAGECFSNLRHFPTSGIPYHSSLDCTACLTVRILKKMSPIF